MIVDPRALDSFLADARSSVGERHVLTEPEDTVSYTTDWTHRWSGTTAAVVRPGSTAEVVRLVAAARQHRVALVPQGGNTGLVGGGVPHAGEVVLSLRRLDGTEPVDRLAGQVTVGAGTTLAALQELAAGAGLAFGIDLAARGSATIGGMIATNAGGLHVMRFGSMRVQVVGIEAVLGSGLVVSRLSGLVKDNTGYDLAQVLAGSEGTLGIVTRARLKLVPPPRELVVALLALRSLPDAVELAAELRRGLAGVRALELMAGDSLRLVAQHMALPPPVRADSEAGAFLLVEVEGAQDPTEELAAAIGAKASIAPLDSAVATTEGDRARLWRFRDQHSDAAVALAAERKSTVHKLDVTLPTTALAGFCEEVTSMVERRWPGATTLLFGHVGDGNVHVNVIEPAETTAATATAPFTAGTVPPATDQAAQRGDEGDETVDNAVLELVVERGGSVSAEHGIGVAKKRWLTRNRSPSEVAAMRAIKAALDPDGILNPNVLLPT